MKVLVTRTDRLGDVVLSLPAIAELAAAAAGTAAGRAPGGDRDRSHPSSVHVLVGPATVPLVENEPGIEGIWVWPAEPEARRALGERLAAERFDAAVILLYEREVARLLRRIGVKRRIGPLSKWSSWLLLNRGVWQARSRRGRHECEYNLELARKLTRGRGPCPRPRLHLAPGQLQIAHAFRRGQSQGRRIVFVHPGMGGSALNWPPRSWAQAANRLAADKEVRVFMTGSAADEPVLRQVREQLAPTVTDLAGRYPLREFMGVLAGGDLFLGPSTGPLHIAAAVGLSVVALYSPLPVHRPRRWGPCAERSQVLVPAVPCPARLVCFGENCRNWNCMESIGVEEVVSAARSLLSESSSPAVAPGRRPGLEEERS